MGGDIWSFACTSLEILRGEPPYKATWDDLLVPRVAMKHVSPYEWADSDDVERVLMGCLEYEPDRRPAIDEVDARLNYRGTFIPHSRRHKT
ncbi:uncharacterized protein EI90DRAFT_1255034 [Cantharellus anzutake]|uniref:uncharacterized protein n=1 Tax=Cantharellus anzutake TaxID=1750568 RepID=UPI0019086F3B|nr:uncharacterized protein EI90DRAFT_1255034 [Cantharellus anzutake]KAF8329995.1 hypothetical protein EI90DRAFT_1255034 [Cantharellus anzutake]